MDRKFIARLFLNKGKESGKVYLKGEIRVAADDLKGFIDGDGGLKIPVFGHTFAGKDKLGNEYKAFNLEVINDDQVPKKTIKEGPKEGKKDYKTSKGSDIDDSPF